MYITRYFIKALLFVAVFLCCGVGVIAQEPPHPDDGSFGGGVENGGPIRNPSGGGTPLESGLLLLVVASSLYAAWKFYEKKSITVAIPSSSLDKKKIELRKYSFLKKVFISLVFVVMSGCLMASTPPPPPGGYAGGARGRKAGSPPGPSTKPIGPPIGAPIGNGVILLLGFGVAFGAYKVYVYKKEEKRTIL